MEVCTALRQPELLYSICSFLADSDLLRLSTCSKLHHSLLTLTDSGLWLERCLSLPALREYCEQQLLAPSPTLVRGLYRALRFPATSPTNLRELYLVLRPYRRLFGYYRKFDADGRDWMGGLVDIRVDSAVSGDDRIALCVLGADGLPAEGFPSHDSYISETGGGLSLIVSGSIIFDLVYRESGYAGADDADFCSEELRRAHLLGDGISLRPMIGRGQGQASELDLRPLPVNHMHYHTRGGAAPPLLTTSVYGGHGREIVFVADCVSAIDSRMRRFGLKVTGDTNVPCNRLSFMVDLQESKDIDEELRADPRPVTTCRLLENEGEVTGEFVLLEPRRSAIKSWRRGRGNISRVPLDYQPEEVSLSYLEYHSGVTSIDAGIIFSLLWDDLGDDTRHLMDFYRYDHLASGPRMGRVGIEL